MDPDPTHLARHMTAQIGKVSVLGPDDVASVAGSGVGVRLVLSLVADPAHNSRRGVLLPPRDIGCAEHQEQCQQESRSVAVHAGVSISAALIRQIYGTWMME